MLKTDMADYYAKRAFEYERIYLKPERQENLKQLQTSVAGSFKELDLLEVACGTGYWTPFAARSARSITAVDCNEEVLDIARKKDYGNCHVSFIKADAYSLEGIDGPFSAALVCFWWSHIPKVKLGSFLTVLHSKLSNGAIVIIMDNRYVKGSSTPINRTDEDGNTYQVRKLSDDSRHEVLKNFPTETEFRESIASVSEDCCLTTLDYYWLAQYRLKAV